MNILIMDDEENILIGIKKRIERSGLQPVNIFMASNAYEAEDILEKENIDLVFADINLPFMSGLEFIEKYKDDSLLFIIISGYDKFEYAQKALKLGVFRYILKPIDKDEFETVLFEAANKLEQNLVSLKNNDNLNRIINVMNHNFNNPNFSLEICSLEVDLSKRQISKLLNNELNISFTDYLNKMRIDYALRLMNKDKRIVMSEIAEACGFVNQQYFSSIFKKIKGETPSSYLKTKHIE